MNGLWKKLWKLLNTYVNNRICTKKMLDKILKSRTFQLEMDYIISSNQDKTDINQQSVENSTLSLQSMIKTPAC